MQLRIGVLPSLCYQYQGLTNIPLAPISTHTHVLTVLSCTYFPRAHSAMVIEGELVGCSEAGSMHPRRASRDATCRPLPEGFAGGKNPYISLSTRWRQCSMNACSSYSRLCKYSALTTWTWFEANVTLVNVIFRHLSLV